MATQTQSAGTGVVPYRINVRQFMKMIDADVFPEGVHVELLGGTLFSMTKNPPHSFVVTRLARFVRSLLPANWLLLEEKSLQLDRWWLPEPDLTVVRGLEIDYARRFPGSKDIGFLVEVADTTYPKDASLKLSRYAAAGVRVCWIVNLARQQVEVYTDPQGRGRTASYRTMVVRGVTEQVPVVIEGQERGLIAVRELFPQS